VGFAGAGTIRVGWWVASHSCWRNNGKSLTKSLARERGPENASHAARLVPPEEYMHLVPLALTG